MYVIYDNKHVDCFDYRVVFIFSC